MNILAISAVLIALLTLVPSSAMAAGDVRAGRTLTITATGHVDAKPDTAVFNSGVVTEGETAAAAIAANAKVVSNLIDGLKAKGVAAQDLQTSQFAVNPRYARPAQDTAPRIDGFEVRNSLSVVARDISQVGELLDTAAKLGANQFGSIEFIVSDAQTRLDAARTNAIASARRQAEVYAKAAGTKLGDVLSITEGGEQGAPRPVMMGRAMAAEAVPVESGTNRLTVSVTVIWELD